MLLPTNKIFPPPCLDAAASLPTFAAWSKRLIAALKKHRRA
jgi:hypothetical protein